MLRLARLPALVLPALVLLAACGTQSNEDALQDAANVSDPAAAAFLENAAENGMDPQQALEQAGQAAAAANAAAAADQGPPSGSVQARPNTREQPNRPEGGKPPEKVTVNTTAEAKPEAEDEHAGHDMNNMQ